MAMLSVKLPDEALRLLRQEAGAQGLSLSELVRRKLDLEHRDDRYDDLDRRVSRLEEMAGL